MDENEKKEYNRAICIEIAKTRDFWLIYFMNFLSIFYRFFMVNNFKTYPENTDHPVLNDDHYLTTVGSVASVFNASRFIWSGALDKFSYKKVYGVLLII